MEKKREWVFCLFKVWQSLASDICMVLVLEYLTLCYLIQDSLLSGSLASTEVLEVQT